VTGLEPGTNYPQHRSLERRQGRMRTLAPGEAHRIRIDCRVHLGAPAIRRLQRHIAALQARAKPEFQTAHAFFTQGFVP
jgi:hypothetical protein